MTAQVSNTLNLQKGDVFTYYDVPSTTVDIETLRNVYILARAEELARGTAYPTAGSMDSTDNVESATGGYNRDYRFLGIQYNTSTLVGPDVVGVHAYYMGIPLAYITDTDGVERNLRVAKDSVTNMPILPGDTAAIATLEGDLDNSNHFYDYNVASLANIYVFDAGAAESEKLLQIKGKDQVRNYLEGLQTVENNSNNGANKKHDILFVKALNTTPNNSFYNLYIIKDVR